MLIRGPTGRCVFGTACQTREGGCLMARVESCALAADGRLDGQVELQCSWRQPESAIDALLNRRIGGKAVLHVD